MEMIIRDVLYSSQVFVFKMDFLIFIIVSKDKDLGYQIWGLYIDNVV